MVGINRLRPEPNFEARIVYYCNGEAQCLTRIYAQQTRFIAITFKKNDICTTIVSKYAMEYLDTMDNGNQYYHPPSNHQQHLRQMVIWLSIVFGGLALAAGLFVYHADKILIHLPFSAEQRFVKPYEKMASLWQAEQPSHQSQKVIEDYLQVLADQLATSIDLPPDYRLQIHYLDSDAVNAFASLGGHIFICRGLLEAVPDENSLAMVMAHEIAHIKHRDPAVGLGRGLTLQLLYSFVSGDYSRGSNWIFYGGDLGLLYFSREQESIADTTALSALKHHYGHITGHTEIFNIMAENHQQRSEIEAETETAISEQLGWLSSHPNLAERINTLNAEAKNNAWHQGTPTDIPQMVINALATATHPE